MFGPCRWDESRNPAPGSPAYRGEGNVDAAGQIKTFLADRFLFDANAAIDPKQSLTKAGILDSTGAMELVLYLEEEFKIRVADTELVPENLDSIEKLAAYVARKSG